MQVFTLPRLPLLPSGKLDRRVLQTMAETGAIRNAPTTPSPPDRTPRGTAQGSAPGPTRDEARGPKPDATHPPNRSADAINPQPRAYSDFGPEPAAAPEPSCSFLDCPTVQRLSQLLQTVIAPHVDEPSGSPALPAGADAGSDAGLTPSRDPGPSSQPSLSPAPELSPRGRSDPISRRGAALAGGQRGADGSPFDLDKPLAQLGLDSMDGMIFKQAILRSRVPCACGVQPARASHIDTALGTRADSTFVRNVVL